jgi:hypothetical protein
MDTGKNMRRIIYNIIRTALSGIFQRCRFMKKQKIIKGYRIISTEYYRYLAFNGKPSTTTMCFISDTERAYVFRDLIDAFPYMLSMDCRFTFEPVIQTNF